MNIKDLPPKYRKQVKAAMKKQEGSITYSDRIEAALLLEQSNKRKKANKFSAEKVTIDGITFDSLKEGEYYATLKLREKAGEISDLVLQPRFLLQDGFLYDGVVYRKVEYVADFQYTENGETVVVDTKGFRTAVYLLKKKLFLAKYGEHIRFMEV